MFVTRGLLHEKVYQHKKVKIIEEMLIDAFTFAKDRYYFRCLNMISYPYYTGDIRDIHT